MLTDTHYCRLRKHRGALLLTDWLVCKQQRTSLGVGALCVTVGDVVQSILGRWRWNSFSGPFGRNFSNLITISIDIIRCRHGTVVFQPFSGTDITCINQPFVKHGPCIDKRPGRSRLDAFTHHARPDRASLPYAGTESGPRCPGGRKKRDAVEASRCNLRFRDFVLADDANEVVSCQRTFNTLC